MRRRLLAYTLSVLLIIGQAMPVIPLLTPSAHALETCTVTTANLLQPTVQAAIDAAADGAVVCLPAGTANWGSVSATSSVFIPANKGIMIQGAGEGVTILTNSHSTQALAYITTAPLHAVSGVSHLTIAGDTVAKSGLNAWIVAPWNYLGSTGTNVVRIHHVTFTNLKNRAIIAFSTASGLIDHNTFNAPYALSVQAVTVLHGGPATDTAFATAYTPGGVNAIYIESNTFNFDFVNDGALDAYSGARVVFRYNTVNGTLVGVHGADSGGYRGPNTVEVYRNTFDKQTAGSTRLLFFRAGNGPAFDNVYTGNYANLEIAVYRSRPQSFYEKYGACDGTSAWDGNDGTGTLPTGNPGWPCLDQTGYTFTTASGGSYAWNPLYAWHNTLNGVEVNPRASLSETTGTATYVISDREWYHYSSIVNSATPQTTGTRVGTLAQRPASCTTGVGYWANDQGSWNTSGAGEQGQLYRCTATDTWTLYYTPYTYPHPLQGAESPPAPDPLTDEGRIMAFSGSTFAIFTWPRSTDAAHKQYNVYRCLHADACTALVYSVTPAQAAARLTTDTQFFDTSLYEGDTYYYSVSDVNTMDYVGPASTPVSITVTGKQ